MPSNKSQMSWLKWVLKFPSQFLNQKNINYCHWRWFWFFCYVFFFVIACGLQQRCPKSLQLERSSSLLRKSCSLHTAAVWVNPWSQAILMAKTSLMSSKILTRAHFLCYRLLYVSWAHRGMKNCQMPRLLRNSAGMNQRRMRAVT